MHIVAQMNVFAVNLKPMRADDFQPIADTVKLRHQPPARVKTAAEIDEKTNGVGFVVTTHGDRLAARATQKSCNQVVFLLLV